MSYKVAYMSCSTEKEANKALRKIPMCFCEPHIEHTKNNTYMVIAGVYEDKAIAEAAVQKLFSSNLWGGIWKED